MSGAHTIGVDWANDHHERVLARMETIRQAFGKAGISLRTSDEFELRCVANWGHFVEDCLKIQDGRSRQLVEVVEAKARELRDALNAAWQNADLPDDDDEIVEEPETDRINICRRLFNPLTENDEAFSQLFADVDMISYRASSALAQGIRLGRGRPSLFAYYAFIRDLHKLYRKHSSNRGFHEKNGTAEGTFVTIVKDSQSILPNGLRIKSPTNSKIGNRVLQAFEPTARPPSDTPAEPFTSS